MSAYKHIQTPAIQRVLPGTSVGETKRPELAPWMLVQKCRDGLDAIRLCVQLSDLSNQEIALRCGIDVGNFTRMMQGKASFPTRKRPLLYMVCGNFAPLQYEAWACNFELVDKRLLTALREQSA
jgi:hypothetical protein